MDTEQQTSQPAPHAGTPTARVDLHAFKGVHLVPVLLLVIGLIVLAVLLVRRGDGHQTTTVPPVGAPAAVSESQLQVLAKKTDHPIYWAGPKDGAYELTRTTDGRIYVRYLPSVSKVGDPAAKYLTIGTYPGKDAFTAIRRAAARQGAVSVKIDSGGLVVFNQSTPKSVYFGYARANYQVEVYDPSPQQARTLVLGGKITAIK